MVIKLQYDAYNRTFKLVDPEVRTLLEDGEIYDLAIRSWSKALAAKTISPWSLSRAWRRHRH